MEAVITKGTGKKSKEFLAIFKRKGRILAHTEHYTRKSNLIKMLKKSFTQFKVVDNVTGKDAR